MPSPASVWLDALCAVWKWKVVVVHRRQGMTCFFFSFCCVDFFCGHLKTRSSVPFPTSRRDIFLAPVARSATDARLPGVHPLSASCKARVHCSFFTYVKPNRIIVYNRLISTAVSRDTVVIFKFFTIFFVRQRTRVLSPFTLIVWSRKQPPPVVTPQSDLPFLVSIPSLSYCCWHCVCCHMCVCVPPRTVHCIVRVEDGTHHPRSLEADSHLVYSLRCSD